MSGNTTIQWTDKTWNPTVGCTKVNQECKFCYAKTVHDKRHKAILDGKAQAPQYREPFEVVQLKPERLRWPISLQKPSRIFVNSVSDLFHDDVPIWFIAQVFVVMAIAQRHTFQVLTKRATRMKEVLSDPGFVDEMYAQWSSVSGAPAAIPAWPLPNVEIGVSAGTQKSFDANVPELLDTPAAVRFVSMEPMLEAIDILYPETVWPDGPEMCCNGHECGCHGQPVDPPMIMNDDMSGVRIDWIIVGGESGTRKQKVRPMNAAWVLAIRNACRSWGIAFFFKQWGEYLTFAADSKCLRFDGQEYMARVDGKTYNRDDIQFWSHDGNYEPGAAWAVRVGTKKAGRLLEGVEHNQFVPRAPAPEQIKTVSKALDLMAALATAIKP